MLCEFVFLFMCFTSAVKTVIQRVCFLRAYMCGQTQGRAQKTVMSRLMEEVEELEEDLKLQTQMNGINLKSCIRKTLQKSENLLFFSLFSLHYDVAKFMCLLKRRLI